MLGIKIHSLFVYTFCTEYESYVKSYTLELTAKTNKTKNKIYTIKLITIYVYLVVY